jgi:hypothetical protein
MGRDDPQPIDLQAHKRKLFKGANSPVPLESIVVIVVLTALVAVMVVAFVGFADDAKDERYAFEAREHVIAVRAVLSESFAVKASPSIPADSDGAGGGTGDGAGGADASDGASANGGAGGGTGDASGGTFRAWHLTRLSEYAEGDAGLFARKAEELFGGMSSSSEDSGAWDLWLMGPTSAASFWEADGFLYEDRIGDGASDGRLVACVTYRMDRIEAGDANEFSAKFWQEATYNSTAGYEVYRFAE